jgi:hypothetical protein
MITLEQKKQLQFDAHTPHLPTDLTYECRMAISGEGERAYEWRDKPHRLVYDLSRQVEADAVRIEELLEEREQVIKASNYMFCVMSDSLNTAHGKIAKAVDIIKRILNAAPYAEDHAGWAQLLDDAADTLAELEGK